MPNEDEMNDLFRIPLHEFYKLVDNDGKVIIESENVGFLLKRQREIEAKEGYKPVLVTSYKGGK